MKVKRSRQTGHVVFDLAPGDVSLMAMVHAEREPELISTVVEEESAFREGLNERATKKTRLLEEILSRSRMLTELELEKSRLDRAAGH